MRGLKPSAKLHFMFLGVIKPSYRLTEYIYVKNVAMFCEKVDSSLWPKSSSTTSLHSIHFCCLNRLFLQKSTNAEIQILNLSFKTILVLPLKKRVFGFWRKTSKKKFFFVFRLWFSFENNKHTIVIWFSIFENAPKKSY